MNEELKFWIVHGGSDSYFAARDANDAWEVVQEMNKISLEYNMPPTSKVEVVNSYMRNDFDVHEEELRRRDLEGDEMYFQP